MGGTHIGPRDLLVINSDGPIKNSYRFPDECVRHKLADLVGDLALIGRAIKGRIVAYKSGHTLNQQLAKKLYEAAQQQEPPGDQISMADFQAQMKINSGNIGA